MTHKSRLSSPAISRFQISTSQKLNLYLGEYSIHSHISQNTMNSRNSNKTSDTDSSSDILLEDGLPVIDNNKIYDILFTRNGINLNEQFLVNYMNWYKK